MWIYFILRKENISGHTVFLNVFYRVPEILWAKLRLQELEELLSPHRIFEDFVDAESPPLYPLLAWLLTKGGSKTNSTHPLQLKYVCNKVLQSINLKIYQALCVSIWISLCIYLASSSHSVVSSEIQGLEGSGGVRKGSYSTYCSV